MRRTVHVCTFDVTSHLRGKRRTYAALKAAVLEAGEFSVFEATATPRDARMFTRLSHDPEIEMFRDPPDFPWTGVRRRANG